MFDIDRAVSKQEVKSKINAVVLHLHVSFRIDQFDTQFHQMS